MIDLPIPPPDLRVGDGAKQDDEAYRKSSLALANRLDSACGISREHRVLDIGCGQARLLRGILAKLGGIERYVGIDVHRPSIDWLTKNVAPLVQEAELVHFPYISERYNPGGERIPLDLELGEFDRIALFSVFSHMWLADISVYLAFIHRSLAPDGRVFLTAFVEDGVEPETENPAGYFGPWKRPLHCVRLNRQELERRMWEADLQIVSFRYRLMSSAQSAYVLQRRAQ